MIMWFWIILLELIVLIWIIAGFFYLPFLIDKKYFISHKSFLWFVLILSNLLYIGLFFIIFSFIAFNLYIFIIQILCLIWIYYLMIFKNKSKKIIFYMILVALLTPILIPISQPCDYIPFFWDGKSEHCDCNWIKLQYFWWSNCLWMVKKY